MSITLNMTKIPTSSDVSELFNNTDPIVVWAKAEEVIKGMSPNYDFTLVKKVYQDVLRMFFGEFPGYCAIKTLYHDLSHTLEVFMCGVRLMHGVHLSGNKLEDDEITLMLLAILMHDIGYAQRKGEDFGTGAQFTQTHVQRGVEFMEQYFGARMLPSQIMVDVKGMILGTEHFRPFAQIDFANDRARMLASIVATADITGQMADRKYPEKLLFLFLEFKEAKFGPYQTPFDLICQTNRFYEVTREKLDGVLGGIYGNLAEYFRHTYGVSENLYLKSIEKNMSYLNKVAGTGEQDFSKMLKRHGVVDKMRAQHLID